MLRAWAACVVFREEAFLYRNPDCSYCRFVLRGKDPCEADTVTGQDQRVAMKSEMQTFQ